ncbi:hypothetical protein D3C79_687210 [compost metagenome]
MEADHQLLGTEAQAVHPVHQRVEHWDDQNQADQLVQQASQGDLTPGGVLHAGAEERQQATADVGANHQADGYRQADQLSTGQGRGEQHGGKAGIGNQRKQCTDQGVEENVTGQ